MNKEERSQKFTHIKNVEVQLANDLPGFGAYLMKETDSMNPDEPAIVLMNLRLAVEAANIDPDSAKEEVKSIITTTLAHELLHAIQDIVGAAITEDDVEMALEQATGEGLEVHESTALLLMELDKKDKEIQAINDVLEIIEATDKQQTLSVSGHEYRNAVTRALARLADIRKGL